MMKRALAVILAGLVLVGCNEEPEPASEEPIPSPPRESAPPSETLTPSATPTKTPDAAPKTAKDLVLAFIEARNDFVHTGDPTEFKKYVHRSCKVCSEYIANVTASYEAGGSLVGQNWTATSFSIADPPGRSADFVAYRVEIDATAGTFRATKDSPVQKEAAGPAAYQFSVRRYGDAWLMSTYSPVGQ